MALRLLGEHSFHLSFFNLYYFLGNPIFNFQVRHNGLYYYHF